LLSRGLEGEVRERQRMAALDRALHAVIAL
jgi:hypothetical protein